MTVAVRINRTAWGKVDLKSEGQSIQAGRVIRGNPIMPISLDEGPAIRAHVQDTRRV